MEFLYSEMTLAFLQAMKRRAQTILSREVGLKVGRGRFFYNNYSYPLVLLLFQDDTRLGYFDSQFYEIGLNKALMTRGDADDVLRHELAHYLTWIIYGPVAHHGPEFRAICKKYGWDKNVYEAKAPLELAKTAPSPIALKVQKLLALASSGNRFEAEQAAIKANELLTKHNIDHIPDQEAMHVKRLLSQARTTPKFEAISTILRTFLVYPVLNKGKGIVWLEVFGSPENIEVAEYVAHFLDGEFERLWKESGLKGTRSKNSFFRGIADGYCKKAPSSKRGIIPIERMLTEKVSMAYPHLSKRVSTHRHCPDGAKLGRMRGSSLTIREGLSSPNNDIKRLQ